MGEILLFKTADHIKKYRSLSLYINDQEGIVMSGCDMGPDVERYHGDYDFEYWLTIDKDGKKLFFEKVVGGIGVYSDEQVIDYIKERFSHESGFFKYKELLDLHKIPYDMFTYA